MPIENIQEKTVLLKKLLDTDCLLLAFSFNLLIMYCQVNYPNKLINYFNPIEELNKLNQANIKTAEKGGFRLL